MSRIQLRPALRAYAHAPPAVETAAPYTNAYSVALDGVNDYANSSAAPITPAGAFSVSLWCKVPTVGIAGTEYIFAFSDSSTYSYRAVISKAKSGSGSSEKVRYTFAMTDGAGGSFGQRAINSATGPAEVVKWRHVVVTSSATSGAAGVGKIYLDGVDSGGTLTAPQLDAGASLDEIFVATRRKSSSGNPEKWFEGNVDEVSCWNRVLSASEITALYNSGTPTDINNTSGVTPDAVAWYRMGDAAGGSGTTIADQIGSVDLTLVSGRAFSTDVPT